jgi:hypothetical protein
LSTEVYDRIPIQENIQKKIVEVAKNDAHLISAKFEEHKKRLREITSEQCKAMDALLKRGKTRRGIEIESMRWVKVLLEDVLTLKEKVTLFMDEQMSNALNRSYYRDEMSLYGLFLKVLRIVDVENRQFFQMLTRGEFAAQTLDVSCAV